MRNDLAYFGRAITTEKISFVRQIPCYAACHFYLNMSVKLCTTEKLIFYALSGICMYVCVLCAYI
jgi:hypothetical protein